MSILLLVIVISIGGGAIDALAAGGGGGGGGGVVSVVEVGANLHTGEKGKSLASTTGYVLCFAAEKKQGMFRPAVTTELVSASGTTTVGSTSSSYNLFGAGFLLGEHIFFFQDGRVLPFFGFNGILMWHQIKLGSPPSGVEPSTQGFSYGYEALAGIDFRSRMGDTALRVETALSTVLSKLAGISNFQLNAFRVSLGFRW